MDVSRYTKKMFFSDVFPTPLGWFAVLLSEYGLRRTSLKPSKELAIQGIRGEFEDFSNSNLELMKTTREVTEAYFAGTGFGLERLPLDIRGMTKFTQECLMVCRTIPVGETRSYLWIAKELGNSKAARAVGAVMARNRLPVVIPCHRVIANSGRLHGYSGGLNLKLDLLTLERIYNTPAT